MNDKEKSSTPRLPFIVSTVSCDPRCVAYEWTQLRPDHPVEYWCHDRFCPVHEFERAPEPETSR